MPRPPDFDLEIIAGTEGYTVQVQSAYQVGELASQPFIPPVDLGALPRARRDVATWVQQARITRLGGSEELRLARTLGGALFDRLFSGELLAGFRASRAALQPGERLRVRLHLPPSLVPLPWEMLYDARENQFLVLATDLTLVRYPEMTGTTKPLLLNGPLQVVAVLASPQSSDYPLINIDREVRRIEAALKGPIDRGQINLDIIRGPDTLGQLRTRLRRPIHVLHVLCHGDLDQTNGEGVLLFEDTDGAVETTSAELMRLQLQKQRGQTQLVLLNACLGALPASNDPFSSVGAALLRGGVPAVIAMQFELAEDTAAELTRVFYAELAAGSPIDQALTEARVHIYGRYPTRLDWVIPVLLLHADDDVLFKVSLPEPISVPPPSPVLSAPVTQEQIPISAPVPSPVSQGQQASTSPTTVQSGPFLQNVLKIVPIVLLLLLVILVINNRRFPNNIGNITPVAMPGLTQTPNLAQTTVVETAIAAETATQTWLDGDDDHDGLSNADELAQDTDPKNRDTDGDELDDRTELERGINPLVQDTDGDGVKDGEEVRRAMNPLLMDTDGDGISDAIDPDPLQPPAPTVVTKTSTQP